jgi:hypothetical protein
VEVLDRPARCLLVALHASQHGTTRATPIRDLERAAAVTEFACWEDASTLAASVDAVPAFAAGLRLSPSTAPIAARLELPSEASLSLLMHVHGASSHARTLHAIRAAPGIGGWSETARRLVPTRAFMRYRYGLEVGDRAGLVRAYLRRWLDFASSLPPNLRVLHRLQSEADASRWRERDHRGASRPDERDPA